MDVHDLTRPTVGRPLAERLDWIFNRGPDGWGSRSSPDEYAPLVGPIRDGRLKVRLTCIPVSVCRRAAKSRRFSSGAGEGAEHQFLKAAAVEWMKANGASDAANEVRVFGRADAWSAKKRWLVECGNTRVSKLTSAIMSRREPVRFTLIPYQRRCSFLYKAKQPVRSIRAVEFAWDADLTEELFWADMKRQAAIADRLPVPSSVLPPLSPPPSAGEVG